MEQPKIKFIQYHKDAQPIKFDGFGFEIPFVDAIPSMRKDGRDIVICYTGYKLVIPQGYMGQVYDTQASNINSIQRLQMTNFITNDFPYETDPQREALGLFVIYLVTGGISSIVFNRSVPLIGINFFRNHGIHDYEVSVDLHMPKTEQTQPQQPQQQPRQQQQSKQPLQPRPHPNVRMPQQMNQQSQTQKN